MEGAREHENAIAKLLLHAGVEFGEVLIEFAASLNDEFGGGGRSGGAHVGNKIGDGEIGLVADAGDDRKGTLGDGASDDFFVEGPEIFERPATTNEENDVDGVGAREVAKGVDDLCGRTFALNANGIEGEMDVGKAAGEDADHIADGGAGGRGDESDAAREKRERLLAGGVKEAFGFKAALELFEGELEGATAERLHGLDVNLIFAADFVDGDGAANGDFEAVFGTKLHAALLLLEEDAADLGALVLEGEIDVTGSGFAAVGDFALDGDVSEIFAKEIANARGEIADGKDAFFGLQIERELSHARAASGQNGELPRKE